MGYLSSLKTSYGGGSCGILCVLTGLENDPLILVVDAPYTTLVLETGSSGLGRGMYAPLVVGGELLSGTTLDEFGEGMFEDGSCRTGPCWGPLSLELDHHGGIDAGLVGDEGFVDDRRRRSLRLVPDTKRCTSL